MLCPCRNVGRTKNRASWTYDGPCVPVRSLESRVPPNGSQNDIGFGFRILGPRV